MKYLFFLLFFLLGTSFFQAQIDSDVVKKLTTKIKPLSSVKDIRVFGMMIGIELKMNCADLVIKALKKRLVINVTKDKIIRLLPPLICEEEHVLKIVDILEQLIQENYEE